MSKTFFGSWWSVLAKRPAGRVALALGMRFVVRQGAPGGFFSNSEASKIPVAAETRAQATASKMLNRPKANEAKHCEEKHQKLNKPRKWKEAGFQLHRQDLFFQEHEDFSQRFLFQR